MRFETENNFRDGSPTRVLANKNVVVVYRSEIIFDTENEFRTGSPTRVLAKHCLSKSFISARFEVMTLTGHPKPSSARVLAKNVFLDVASGS